MAGFEVTSYGRFWVTAKGHIGKTCPSFCDNRQAQSNERRELENRFLNAVNATAPGRRFLPPFSTVIRILVILFWVGNLHRVVSEACQRWRK